MGLWYNGFYKDLEELKKEYDDADFGFLENEFMVKDEYVRVDAHDFLHGLCDFFAVTLHMLFGYDMYAIYDDKSNLVHAYCVHQMDGILYFIDVRGCINDFNVFMEEFEGFVTITDDFSADIRPYQPDLETPESLEVIKYYEIAKKLIQEFKNYYNPFHSPKETKAKTCHC